MICPLTQVHQQVTLKRMQETLKGKDTEKTCRKCHKFPETLVAGACSIWFFKGSKKTVPLIYRHDDALKSVLKWLPRVFTSNPRYRVTILLNILKWKMGSLRRFCPYSVICSYKFQQSSFKEMELFRDRAIFFQRKREKIHGNFTFFPTLTSQKSENTRGSRSNEHNTRPSNHARMCIMHIATENLWFLRELQKPFLRVHFCTIKVISHQL